MKKFYFLLIVFFILIATKQVLAEEQSCQIDLPCGNNNQVTSTATTSAESLKAEEICIYYFYGQGCPHCADIEPFIKDLAKKYPEVQLKKLEIYYNEANRQKLRDFYWRFQVKKEKIPAVFIGEQAFIGVEPIRENLEKQIKYYLEHGPICPETINKNRSTEGGWLSGSPTSLTLGTITLAALADSINPCAFSVLIFLLVYLLVIRAEKRLLRIGLIYIGTVFLVYFFSGLGLFAIIKVSGLSRLIVKIAAFLAIVAGLINVKDFFWPGRGPSLKIPESKKPILEKYIKQATLPAAVALGFLVSLFELPCTGSVYLAILSLLANKVTKLSAIPYLLYYNLLFVLPLLVILVLVAKGLQPEKLETLRKSYRGWLRLIIGVALLLLGGAMLLGII
jgi:cytochrome c biogenesis protein CcdA/glutaredoxin